MFDNMDDFYGSKMVWFVGTVESTSTNYVNVRCIGIHGIDNNTKISGGDLPPAVVLYPCVGGQAGSGYGQHNLDVGTWVVGFFADGEACQQPIIMGVVGEGVNTNLYSSKYSSGNEVEGPGSPTVDSSATMNIPGGSNVEKAYNFCYQKLTELNDMNAHMHAAAICGVLMLEATPKINPAIEGGYMGRAWGICQWLGPRKKKLFAMYGATKDLSQQLSFMWHEMSTVENTSLRKLLSSNNMPDAVAAMCGFERAEEWNSALGIVNRNHKNYKIRLKYAYQVFNTIKNSKANWNLRQNYG